MLDRFFNVLLVDDEPDILAISKLALKHVSLYGLPLRIHTAQSKAEAIDFLTKHPEGRNLALAIIDVVMETDHAGLELCQFVRDELGNHIVPLIVRTGQAGKAPERDVIDRYEISGYINKVEATEGRLYSLIKGAVRQYAMTSYDHYASQLLSHVIANLRSRARFRKAVETGLAAIATSPDGKGSLESMHDGHCMVSTVFFAGTGELADVTRARALADRLDHTESTMLSPSGDRLVVSDQHMMIHVEPTRDFTLPLRSVWTIGAPPPPFAVRSLYTTTKQVQILMSMIGQ